MSSFCGKCGTQLRAGAKFCQACGTPVHQPQPESLPPTMHMAPAPPAATPSFAAPESAQPAPFNSYEPPAYAPQYNPMPVAEKKKSSGVLKALLITLVIFGFLVVVAVGGIFFFVRKAVRNVGEMARNGELDAGFGKIKVNTKPATEEELGVAIFQPSERTGENVNLGGRTDEGEGGISVSTFTTKSSVEEVANFYREKLKDKSRFTETREGENKIVMVSENEQGMRNVAISSDDDGMTKFVITSVIGKNFRKGGPRFPPPPADHPPENIPPPPPPGAVPPLPR